MTSTPLAGAMEFTPQEVLAVVAYLAITAILLLTFLGYFLAGLVKAARVLPDRWRWLIAVPVAFLGAAIVVPDIRLREAFVLCALVTGTPLIHKASKVFGIALAVPALAATFLVVHGVR